MTLREFKDWVATLPESFDEKILCVRHHTMDDKGKLETLLGPIDFESNVFLRDIKEINTVKEKPDVDDIIDYDNENDHC